MPLCNTNLVTSLHVKLSKHTATRARSFSTRYKQLADLGVVSPRWHLYKKEVLKYCLTSKWGKRVPLPEYVYYLPVSNRKEGQSVYDTGVAAFA